MCWYLSFQRPQKATASEIRDEGGFFRFKRDKLWNFQPFRLVKSPHLKELSGGRKP